MFTPIRMRVTVGPTGNVTKACHWVDVVLGGRAIYRGSDVPGCRNVTTRVGMVKSKKVSEYNQLNLRNFLLN